jgi:RHS repeat-associated protein
MKPKSNSTMPSNSENAKLPENGKSNTQNLEEHYAIGSLTQPTPSKSLQIDIPKIELPKGGGAISKIDEKFKVNPSNGTASFSIPLPLSPGRNGFSPQLGLSYNSGAGNGPFGLGWMLEMSNIARKTDRGIPRYQNENDVFVLSGAEDLVPYLVENAPGNWQGVVQVLGDYTITRYRPRVTSDHSRIERIDHPDHITYWRVTGADNTVTIYGRSAACRIADPENDTHIFKWLPEFRYDQKGNWIGYEYISENSDEVNITINEANRISGLRKFTNKYLKRIKYGNLIPWFPAIGEEYDPELPADNTSFFELVVDFGEHDQQKPTPAGVPGQYWETRPDPFSSYRSGFEIRTYRLVKRILMFHHFKDELQHDGSAFGENYLVRSIDLHYSPSSFNGSGQAEMTYLTSVVQKGYVRKPDSSYAVKSLPPMEFSYQTLNWSTEIRQTGKDQIENMPTGLSNNYTWIDLYGEGISGLLTEQGNGWYYKHNLGNVSDAGKIEFEAAKQVNPKPSFTGLSDGSLTIVDLNADGKKEVMIASDGINGFFEMEDEEWKNFQSFTSQSKIDISDPNVKIFDITGDGKADIVLTEERVITFYQSAGHAGYLEHQSALKALNEEEGPALVFADQENTIFLADMTGDGLSDIVRICNGSVCYWANMGYGKYSSKINMGNVPLFDLPDNFNSRHIHLADITGSGTTDIIYKGKNTFQAYLNLGGNALSDLHSIEPFFPIDHMVDVKVVDLLGSGTACLVWSSSLPGDEPYSLRYIDLMSCKKPHVLSTYKNNMGKEVLLEYRSSTWFYLKDKLDGKPWITKLPFPVQVISKTTSTDAITDVRFSTEYKYHHGYFDAEEREFRGFGMVEQIDSEFYSEWKDANKDNRLEQSEALFQPPLLTKTWYHTGAFLKKSKILSHFESEHWFNEFERQFPGELGALTQPTLDDAILKLSASVQDAGLLDKFKAEDFREAVRACKGMILRSEIFALDAPESGATNDERKKQLTPFSAASHNCHIIVQQPRAENKHACFQVLESEAYTIQYEREIIDPRISHSLNISLDRYGSVLESAKIAYPRQQIDSSLPQHVRDDQAETHIVYTKNGYTNDVISPANYRLRVLCETETYALTAISKSGNFYTLSDFTNILDTGTTEIPYESVPDNTTPHRRKIEHVKTLYFKDDLSGPLAFGTLASLGIKYQSYQLTFTPSFVTYIFGGKISDANFPSTGGKFVHFNGDSNWWTPSGHSSYLNAGETATDSQNRFFSPLSFSDALGNDTTIEYYKNYFYFISKVIDPIGNESAVDKFNFRMLSPVRSRDINDNISEVVMDELGFVKALAVMGKDINKDGITELEIADNLTGINEWSDDEAMLLQTYFQETDSNNIDQTARTFLKHASARFLYDPQTFITNGKPTVASSILREKHHAHLSNGEESPLQIKFEYTDGYGNVAMIKTKSEPGPAKQIDVLPDLSYTIHEIDTGALMPPQVRWLGNGRTVLNNKGNPVKQYEPFFSSSPAYESAPELVETGVTPILFYDSLSRNYRTEFPDGTYTEVKFGAWKKKIFDKNDTAIHSEWYTNRINNLIDPELLADGKDPGKEKTAAQKSAAHSDTPTRVHFDSLGRTVFTVAHNKRVDNSDEFIATYIDLDIEGNAQRIEDARDNTVVQFYHDMLGRRLRTNSMDSGERWEFYNAAGKALKTWDSRNHIVEISYDALLRVTEKKITNGDGAVPLNHVFERIEYGEGVANDKLLNLRGSTFAHYDTAGKIETPVYDFKGNIVQQVRKFTTDYKSVVNWQGNNPDSALQAGPGKLSSQKFDALNRVTQKTCPDGSVIMHTYNESGLLDTVTITQSGLTETSVKGITYNEKSQRKSIIYGNDVKTTYKYDRETFRLLSITSRRLNNELLQELHYTYDATGNITEIEDKAIPVVFFGNHKVEPRNRYTYNAVYRLIEAEGKEHIGQVLNNSCDNWNDLPFLKKYNPGSDLEWRNYTQRYQYDLVGNITQMAHVAPNGNWTRNYTYETSNNRLINTSIGSQTFNYSHHPAHGYIISLPHLQQMDWNFRDELVVVSRQNACTDIQAEATYYVYDGNGMRVRKITENQAIGGNPPSIKEERQYIGDIEIYFKITGTNAGLERVSLHVSDDLGRIALIDTRNNIDDGTDQRTVRYQLGNRSGSAALELNETAEVISYEEFHPYGTTAYQASNSGIRAAAKRYRYTGMERDEESGLECHNARYYLPWLGRWLKPDPKGIKDGINRYRYVSNNPVRLIDPNGKAEIDFGFEEIVAEMSGYWKSHTKSSGQDLVGVYTDLMEVMDDVDTEINFHFPDDMADDDIAKFREGVFDALDDIENGLPLEEVLENAAYGERLTAAELALVANQTNEAGDALVDAGNVRFYQNGSPIDPEDFLGASLDEFSSPKAMKNLASARGAALKKRGGGGSNGGSHGGSDGSPGSKAGKEGLEEGLEKAGKEALEEGLERAGKEGFEEGVEWVSKKGAKKLFSVVPVGGILGEYIFAEEDATGEEILARGIGSEIGIGPLDLTTGYDVVTGGYSLLESGVAAGIEWIENREDTPPPGSSELDWTYFMMNGLSGR